ncbi:hypothetical protein ZEAMMB73_Zm00001d020493, partial [Zea mays]
MNIPEDVHDNHILLSPESPLSRQDLVSWKMALDKRQLPEVDRNCLFKLSGYIDIDKINTAAWPALAADLDAGDQSITALAFGFTRLFQPNKPVTKGQAALAFSAGDSGEVVLEELARIEAEKIAEAAVNAHAALVAQLRSEVEEHPQNVLSKKVEVSFEKSRIEKLQKEIETHILSDLKLIIHRVKVSTTPDGRVVDLFFITDGMELLHRKERQDETCSALTATLGPSISCEVVPAEGFQQGFSSLPPEIAEELFRAELADTDSEVCSSPLSAELRKVRTTATVNFDNSLSPAHTLVQIVCVYQKVLIYDILRTMKDCNIQYELAEVERKALSMARAWAEEEAKKAREHARALEEARNQWERQGIRVVVEGELKDDASAGVTWANAGKEHAVDESINRAEALLESQDNV